ncbi:MAG TPA: helix-turn-helix domain-containing protein [Rhodoblastus sp.]|nr:helix-turn-helix domain-containing protein [Rhodoblastus sp.]
MPRISAARKDERRRQILDAALALFARDGFHQVGMSEIVAACGLSRGAVYLYFASKDALIEALADDRHAAEALLNADALRQADPLAALRALVSAYARALVEPGAEARRRVSVHGWAEALRSERVRASIVEGVDVPRRLVAGLVTRAQAAGRLAADLDADAVARTLIAVFQGFVLQASWGEPLDPAACVAVVERMIDGLAAGKGT